MATRAPPDFIAVYRGHHRETRSLIPTGQAIAQLLRAALTAFTESRRRKADREIARVLRVRTEDLARRRWQQPCDSAVAALNLDAARRV